ncbi:hypothetical protein DIS24_g7214 [Lasiodiplodia hormozganensis]|uniref:Uncharacterized protein n=1 Tax=Lasiodiplodia hormozganensis TaxID=869390 RepID=A0AA39Y8F5_9PEZI|nr:hypothetical protein DIS24_g7214 [Lasiodiplodia hormozganensis]
MSTMNKKLALAAKMSQSTGLSMDRRGWAEQSMADMAPECALLQIERLESTRLPESQDFIIGYPDRPTEFAGLQIDSRRLQNFIIGYPHDEVVICEAIDSRLEAVHMHTRRCPSCPCPKPEEHDPEWAYDNYPPVCALIAWKGKDAAIFPQSVQHVSVFVNGEFVPTEKFRIIHPDDCISLHKSANTKPLYQIYLRAITYDGPRPTHYTKEFEKKELARLHRHGSQWSLNTPTVIIIAVAMVVLSRLAMFFFRATPSNAVN